MKRWYFSLCVSHLAALFGCHAAARSPLCDVIAFHDNLNYSAQKTPDHGFDLYVPKKSAAAIPAAIFIHGGYWRNQSRSYYTVFTGLYQNFGLALAKRGIATAVIDYRLFPQAKIAEQYADIAAALAHVKVIAPAYGIDAQRLCLVGHSAGAQLALVLAWQKKVELDCVVALSPILDIAHMRKSMDEKFNRELTTPHFGTGSDDPLHSPLFYAEKKSPRTLILVGGADDEYLRQQAEQMQAVLRAKELSQIQVQFVEKLDHSDMVLVVNRGNDPISDRIANFIRSKSHGSQNENK